MHIFIEMIVFPKKKIILIWCLLGSGFFLFSQQSQGKITIHQVSGIKLAVYTPPNYSPEEKYPVLYVNDGQWLFSYPESIQLDRQLDSVISEKKVPPLIAVGIYSDVRERAAAYVPYPDPGVFGFDPHSKPKAKWYAHKLTKKIIPFIDKHYSTNATPKNRAIFGFSFGGLQATWMALNYPDYFGMSAGFSPSYWVADYQIFTEAEKYRKGNVLWFDIGTREWNYYIPMIKKITDRGGIYGTSLFYFEVPEGKHLVDDWKTRILYPIYLFAGRELLTIKSWDIETEVIKSQSKAGIYYLRINPVVTLKNGVKYSLATQAGYRLLNASDGEIKEDGRFRFFTKNDLNVEITYKDLKKLVVIKYNSVKEKMN